MRRIKELRALHSGQEVLRDAGDDVTNVGVGPAWLAAPTVLVTSPAGLHDVLGRTDGVVERTSVHEEMRHLTGENLFDMTQDRWLPRRRALQTVFTKHQVTEFAGDMVGAAHTVTGGWSPGEWVDLDAECRRLTLRALGRSVMGLDLDEVSGDLGTTMRVALSYIADRSLRPVRAPRWLPTPARRHARAASATLRGLAARVLENCRADPAVAAPLVRALTSAVDPDSGRPLDDDEICSELIAFLLAGHDTTATTLTYALWALGRHPEIQQRVAAEADELRDHELTAADVPHLRYTVQVLHEALRLCPPGPALGREASCDIAVDGHRIPRGSLIVAGIYAVHRDPRYWENPLTFDPDRFDSARAKQLDRWQYLPFGAGPRSCIGDHFAMLEVTLALATIIGQVEIVSTREDFPLTVPFTMVAAEPAPARIVRRRAAATMLW
ncbi:cytochrome P450 [Gordonia sp. N1V]|uniref:cytochrome P450 n=1 Tax=Gordonia sp. N1V TaxID=3034163 RepID=UPI0023E2D07A|nr:cytochrome P450 [Gordonia sp. N1V]MDF3285334.1 cytochrome P450 [Gordonia sp. N1V]